MPRLSKNWYRLFCIAFQFCRTIHRPHCMIGRNVLAWDSFPTLLDHFLADSAVQPHPKAHTAHKKSLQSPLHYDQSLLNSFSTKVLPYSYHVEACSGLKPADNADTVKAVSLNSLRINGLWFILNTHYCK